MQEYDIDLIWYSLWYASYHQDEQFFAQIAALLLKVMLAVFPTNIVPIYAERQFSA